MQSRGRRGGGACREPSFVFLSCTFFDTCRTDTQALLSAIAVPDPNVERKRSRIVLEGSVTSPINLPDNCRFCIRCRYCTERCRKEAPKRVEVKPGHFVACHRIV